MLSAPTCVQRANMIKQYSFVHTSTIAEKFLITFLFTFVKSGLMIVCINFLISIGDLKDPHDMSCEVTASKSL